MAQITFTTEELSGIKNRQIQRLIAKKTEKELADSLLAVRADPAAQGVLSVKNYLALLDRIAATAPTVKTRKQKSTRQKATA
jgi:hypothetical protein